MKICLQLQTLVNVTVESTDECSLIYFVLLLLCCLQVPANSLALPEDGHQQVVRVHARDSRRRPGHGVRYFHQNCSEMQETVCTNAGKFHVPFSKVDG